VVGLYAAFQLTDVVVEWGLKNLHWEKTTLMPLSFVLLFLGIGAAIYFGGKLLETALKVVKLSVLNNLAGALLGILQWMYLVGTLLLFVLANDSKQNLISAQTRNQSMAVPFYTDMLQNTLPKISEGVVFDAYLQQAKEQLIEEETPKEN
ncbi:MAG: CvpA family protein, partial [Crocinitomicaceae bacterium]|nr:CvpA family protein [Crocinitomicaceae bacterium]